MEGKTNRRLNYLQPSWDLSNFLQEFSEGAFNLKIQKSGPKTLLSGLKVDGFWKWSRDRELNPVDPF